MVTKSNKASLTILALSHGITDLYANFLPALLPIFEAKFALSKTMIGVLIFAMSISGSMFQVVYGYLGDKWSRRLFLVPGPAIAAVFMSFIGLSPSFLVLFILLLLGGMGVSAYHPHAASYAGDLVENRRGFGLSIFMTGGTIGFAVGPLVAAGIMSTLGAEKMPLASVVGIVTSILLYKYSVPQKTSATKFTSRGVFKTIRSQLMSLAFLSIIVILRGTVFVVFTNFLSLLADQRGQSLIVGGSIIFLFLLFSGIGTLLGGFISDHIDRRKLLVVSLLLSSPLLLGMVYSRGIVMVIFLAISGIVLGFPNPVPLSIAQELIPEGASTASSIMMGFSWGIAGLLTLGFGALADAFGGNVVPAMSIAALLPVLAVVFALILPKRHSHA